MTPGSLVRYHGSHVRAHGVYRLVGPCGCTICRSEAWIANPDPTWVAYDLLPIPGGPRYLPSHVKIDHLSPA